MSSTATNVSRTAEEDPVPTTHPTGFFFIFWGEFAERCCYYGMRALLPLYLTTVLHYSDAEGSELYTNFKSWCYFLPLAGGLIADQFLGKYRTILSFSVFYVAGLFLLCIPNTTAMMAALILMACGSGVIKPNISTLMGMTYDQQRPGQIELRAAGFRWFYFSVNVGSFVSLYFLPKLRELIISNVGDRTQGYQLSFLTQAIMMVIALTAFALGKKYYAKETIQRHAATPEEKAERRRVVVMLLGIFGLMSFYWFAYEQNDFLWVFFARDHMTFDAEKTKCLVNLGFTTLEYTPDGFQFLNAGCVLVCIPIFGYIFTTLDAKGMRIRATQKMLVGFILTAVSTGIMALAAKGATTETRVSTWWLVAAYIVLTVGEVLVYGTGLELSFAAAPATMKSFISACFLCTSAIGNQILGLVSQVYNSSTAPGEKDTWKATAMKSLARSMGIEFVTPYQFYIGTMCVVLVSAVAFYFVGRRFDRTPQAT